MTIAKGAIAKTLRLLEVVPLTREDLERLRSTRHNLSTVEVLRDAHHQIARLMALGMKQQDIARAVGYSVTRISQLANSPAFQELLALKREKLDEQWAETADHFLDLATHNMMRAERMIADHFDRAEANDELIPFNRLVALRADTADRVGYGKKQMNLNVNVDFAAKLEAARKRSAPVIEGKGVGLASGSPAPALSEPAASSAPEQAPPLRRAI